MGNDLATPGKQSAAASWDLRSSNSQDVAVPGKTTLTETLASSPAIDLARVASRAGERVVDRGKFEYVVRPDGSFEIVKAPVPYTASQGRRITLDELPAVWGILHALLLACAAASPAAPTTAAPAPARSRGKARTPVSEAERATNDARMRSRWNAKTKTMEPIQATVEGNSTLEIAATRAALGNEGTHYRRKDATDLDVKKMVTGAPDATTFWCSGFSMWTLAAAGYNLDSQVLGSDGKPFTFTGIVTSQQKDPDKKKAEVDAGRANAGRMKQVTDAGFVLAEDEYPTHGTITFRKLIDGHGLPVLAMSMIEADPQRPGGWRGVIREPANSFAGLIDGPDHTALAAMGAPGAFELFGIGHVVPELEQKPGDFAQERWLENGAYTGAGHAYQVWSVTAKGSAMFGEKGSPEPADGAALSGWHEGTTFRITKDTNPSHVGEHVVIAATRIEANIEDAFAKDPKDKKPATRGDGGVQITNEHAVPNVNRHEGCVVFYGRLGSSPWAHWVKATFTGIVLAALLTACSSSTPPPSPSSATAMETDNGAFEIRAGDAVVVNETFTFAKHGDGYLLRSKSLGVSDPENNLTEGELELDGAFRPRRARYRMITPADGFTYTLGGTPLTLDVTRDDERDPQHVVAATPPDVYVAGPGLAALTPLCSVVTKDVMLRTLGNNDSPWERELEAYRGAPVGTLQRVVVDMSMLEMELVCDGPRLVAGGYAKMDVWFVRKGRDADLAALKAAPRPTAHAWKRPIDETKPWDTLHTFVFADEGVIVVRDQRKRENRLTTFSLADGKQLAQRQLKVPGDDHVMCEALSAGRLVCANAPTKYLQIVEAKTLVDKVDLFPLIAGLDKLDADWWRVAYVEDDHVLVNLGIDEAGLASIDLGTRAVTIVPVPDDVHARGRPRSPAYCIETSEPLPVGAETWSIEDDKLVRSKTAGTPSDLALQRVSLLSCKPKVGGAYALASQGDTRVLTLLGPDGAVRW